MSRPGQSYEPILEGWSVSSIVADICQRAGVPFNGIDTSLLEGFVDGFSVTNQEAAFARLQALGDVYLFDASSFDGAVQFLPRGEQPVMVLGEDDTLDTETTDKREDPISVPAIRRLEYFDTEGGLTPDVQTSDRSLGERIVSEVKVETTVIMRADDAARSVVIGHKVAAEDARGRVELQFPLGMLQLVPGAVVVYEDERMRVESVELDEASMSCKLRYDRRSAYESTIQGVPAAEVSTPPSLVASPTELEVFEIPVLNDSEDYLSVGVAASPQSTDWTGAAVEMSRDGGANWPVQEDVLSPAVIGSVVGGSMPVRSTYIPDAVSSLDVELLREDMALEHAELSDMMNRSNLALIGDELVNFGTVQQIGPKTWRLSNFLRGRKGTTVAAHMVGQRFVLLDGAGPEIAQAERFDLGRTLSFRATSFTRTPFDSAQTLAFSGISQRERAPAYLRAYRSGTDLLVTWQGVGRLGGGARVGMGQFFIGFRVTLGSSTWETSASSITIPYVAGTLQVQQLNSITGAGPATTIEV